MNKRLAIIMIACMGLGAAATWLLLRGGRKDGTRPLRKPERVSVVELQASSTLGPDRWKVRRPKTTAPPPEVRLIPPAPPANMPPSRVSVVRANTVEVQGLTVNRPQTLRVERAATIQMEPIQLSPRSMSLSGGTVYFEPVIPYAEVAGDPQPVAPGLEFTPPASQPQPTGFEPYEVAVLGANTAFLGLAAANGRAYVAGPLGVAVHAVTEDGSSRLLCQIPVTRPDNYSFLAAEGDRVYRMVQNQREVVCDGPCRTFYWSFLNGFRVSDGGAIYHLGEAAAPQQDGSASSSWNAPPAVSVAGPKVIFATERMDPERELVYFADKNMVSTFTVLDNQGYEIFIAWDSEQGLAVMADGATVSFYSTRYSLSIRPQNLVSSLRLPADRGASGMPPGITEAAGSKGLLLIVMNTGKLLAVDYKDPGNPRVIDEWRLTARSGSQVEVDGEFGVVASGMMLTVADLSSGKPRAAYQCRLPFLARELALDGKLAYLRDSGSEVHVYRISP